MTTLINRVFVVDVPLETAWHHLACVEAWPSWAKHSKAVELIPSGEVGPQSKGVLHLRNGLTTKFQMQEFRPFEHWKWVDPLLGNITVTVYETKEGDTAWRERMQL